LYAFVRRQGFAAEEARDLTQEFFARLLEKDFLAAVDRGKGRFRSFLLAACKHFLANERDRVRARKRGGDTELLSIQVADAEDRYRLEPAHVQTAEKLFERRWALTLLDHVLGRLRAEAVRSGKGELFDHLKVFLGGEKTSQRGLAQTLGMSEGAIKVAVHRLRKRYRELLHQEITRTMSATDSIEDEIRFLFQALES
jgi:RNA polymerase sigma-70 factor (ECF subfamily)